MVFLGSEKNLRSLGGNSSNPAPSVSFGEGDLERMRGSIQALVQQTGPLGAVMDFLQEDLSLMNAELHKWEEEARRCEGEQCTNHLHFSLIRIFMDFVCYYVLF